MKDQWKVVRKSHGKTKDMFWGSRKKCNDKLKQYRNSNMSGYHCGWGGPKKVEFVLERNETGL